MRPGKLLFPLLLVLALPSCEKHKEAQIDEKKMSAETRQKLGELLIDAARHGEAERVEKLLEQGADIRAHDSEGETVLHAVFSRRNWRLDLGLVMLLLQEGADLKARDQRGWTPLHAAAERGRREATEFLLDKGADLKAIDRDGQTPLHLAAGRANDKVVKLLIARGADPLARDKSQKTPLHMAEEEDQKETAKLLISHGADILAKDSFGHAPAGWLVKTCFEELEAGQRAGNLCSAHRDLRSYTLLYAAVEGHLEAVRYLIDQGADVNVSRSFHEGLAVPGVTPLHGAASRGHLEVARLLIASGAQLDIKDKYGRTPLQWAAWKKHQKMIDLLSSSVKKPTRGKD